MSKAPEPRAARRPRQTGRRAPTGIVERLMQDPAMSWGPEQAPDERPKVQRFTGLSTPELLQVLIHGGDGAHDAALQEVLTAFGALQLLGPQTLGSLDKQFAAHVIDPRHLSASAMTELRDLVLSLLPRCRNLDQPQDVSFPFEPALEAVWWRVVEALHTEPGEWAHWHDWLQDPESGVIEHSRLTGALDARLLLPLARQGSRHPDPWGYLTQVGMLARRGSGDLVWAFPLRHRPLISARAWMAHELEATWNDPRVRRAPWPAAPAEALHEFPEAQAWLAAHADEVKALLGAYGQGERVILPHSQLFESAALGPAHLPRSRAGLTQRAADQLAKLKHQQEHAEGAVQRLIRPEFNRETADLSEDERKAALERALTGRARLLAQHAPALAQLDAVLQETMAKAGDKPGARLRLLATSRAGTFTQLLKLLDHGLEPALERHALRLSAPQWRALAHHAEAVHYARPLAWAEEPAFYAVIRRQWQRALERHAQRARREAVGRAIKRGAALRDALMAGHQAHTGATDEMWWQLILCRETRLERVLREALPKGSEQVARSGELVHQYWPERMMHAALRLKIDPWLAAERLLGLSDKDNDITYYVSTFIREHHDVLSRMRPARPLPGSEALTGAHHHRALIDELFARSLRWPGSLGSGMPTGTPDSAEGHA